MVKVPERVPLVCRLVTVVLSLIAAITAGSGGIKSCTFAQEKYSSQSQVNFLIAVGILVIIFLTLRIVAFDVKRRRLPSVVVQLIFDAVFALLAFAAAIAVAAAPVGNEICYGDLKEFMEEACDFRCSNVIASVVMMFLTFIGFLVDILFVAGVIRVASAAQPAEDFTFGETVGTPRAAKAQANASTPTSTSV